jgi:hypothetical protein
MMGPVISAPHHFVDGRPGGGWSHIHLIFFFSFLFCGLVMCQVHVTRYFIGFDVILLIPKCLNFH